ncbi:hypothetical protein FACS1894179_07280 [Bacteroidia bacterium]|nr:hypothetical protein FACS1894179_07280 [Bacteroidia bacterium]
MSTKKRKNEIKKKKRNKQKVKIKTMCFFAKAKHQNRTTSIKFGLCDDPLPAKNPAYIDESDDTKWIAIVENNQENTITFTAIDHCNEFEFPKKGGNAGEIGKRCDCALTTNAEIVFVELKERNYRGWIADADEQLRSTIDFFNQHLEAKKYLIKQAYIANRMRPITKTNQQTRIEKFLNNTGYILRIKNRIII